MVSNEEEKGIVIFKAYAYRTYLDTAPSSVGYARGARKDRGVDRDFWLAYECLRRAGAQIPVWGIDFIDSLETVEVLDDEKK